MDKNTTLALLKPPVDFASLGQFAKDGDRYVSLCAQANLNRHIFGGQLMAQAVLVAASIVAPDRRLRSLHARFLRPQLMSPAPGYRVNPVMEGRSFSNVEVSTSESGKEIFRSDLCFQSPEAGMEHALVMSEVPAPEDLINLREMAVVYADQLSEGNRRLLSAVQLHEVKPIDPKQFLFCGTRQPALRFWVKSSQPLTDVRRLHEAALAYISDAWFNSPMLLPHVSTRLAREFHAPTLSHDLWLHNDFRADDWLLFGLQSPALNGATGLILASIFDRSGKLIANAAQHALFRQI